MYHTIYVLSRRKLCTARKTMPGQHTGPSYPPASAKLRAILMDNERRTADSATSGSVHTPQDLHIGTGIERRLAFPSACRRLRESFAAMCRAALETPLRCASALFVDGASHRRGNQSLPGARMVL